MLPLLLLLILIQYGSSLTIPPYPIHHERAAPSTDRSFDGLLIVGHGRVGRQVAQCCTIDTSDGRWSIFANLTGTVRTLTDVVEEANPSTIPDVTPTRLISVSDVAAVADAAQRCSHVLVTIPPLSPSCNNNTKDDTANSAIEPFFDSLLATVLSNLPSRSWIGVLSTTGVYGNHGGDWVTEDTPPRGQSAQRYLDYEDWWMSRTARDYLSTDSSGDNHSTSDSNCSTHAVHLFRCAGIYGPEASALHTVYRRGVPSNDNGKNINSESKNGSATIPDLTNRIHIYDLAEAIVASMRQHGTDDYDSRSGSSEIQQQPQIYNLADDAPASRARVLHFAAHLLQKQGIAVPLGRTDATGPSSSTSSRRQRRGTDVKRVSNARMKQQLIPTLNFPTYREGLTAIVQSPSGPWWRNTVNSKGGTTI